MAEGEILLTGGMAGLAVAIVVADLFHSWWLSKRAPAARPATAPSLEAPSPEEVPAEERRASIRRRLAAIQPPRGPREQ